MIDINIIRTNPELVKENIRKKFQDHKLHYVDEILELDEKIRNLKKEGDNLRSQRNNLSSQIGKLMKDKNIDEANKIKAEVVKNNERIEQIEAEENELSVKLKKLMCSIPNIIDNDVPIGKDDKENVQRLTVGEAKVPDYEIPYHVDILESLNGLDLDSARRTSGNGFYYLTGDIARLHSSILSYARDFMIDKGFTYCVPPFMIRCIRLKAKIYI